MHRKKKGDHLLPWQAAHLHQLHVHFIIRHFTALPPIFDHKQRANFDLTWNSTKRDHSFSARSSQSVLQNGGSHFVFPPHQKWQLEDFVMFQEKWQVRLLETKKVWNNKPSQCLEAPSLGEQKRQNQFCNTPTSREHRRNPHVPPKCQLISVQMSKHLGRQKQTSSRAS